MPGFAVARDDTGGSGADRNSLRYTNSSWIPITSTTTLFIG